MPDDLSHPGAVMGRLEAIERDLAVRQNGFEAAAGAWYTAKREIERVRAHALLTSSEPSVTEKKARADLAAYDIEGAASEAEYEAIKAAIRVLETRGMIAMALLKSQGRA